MNASTPTRQQLIDAIKKLPTEVLPELADFLSYLQFKIKMSAQAESPEPEGSAFLLSIAGLGELDEDSLSERDEDILATEIDPVRGWGFDRDS